jgi:ribosomal protein S8
MNEVKNEKEIEGQVVRIEQQNMNNPIMPVLDAESFKKTWEGYEKLKNSICTEADVQEIGGKNFKKKSFWRKLETAFNIRISYIQESEKTMKALIRITKKEMKNANGSTWTKETKDVELYPMDWNIDRALTENEKVVVDTMFSYILRATAPNGVYTDGDGHCSIWEDGYSNSYHNVKSTAFTRAKNRAISDLVGGGEVSADEIGNSENRSYAKPQQQTQQPTDPHICQFAKHAGKDWKDVPPDYVDWIFKNQISKLSPATVLYLQELIKQPPEGA